VIVSLPCEQVKSTGVSRGITEIGQAFQSLDAEGCHASVSYQNS
jgi:hypothetical protein